MKTSSSASDQLVEREEAGGEEDYLRKVIGYLRSQREPVNMSRLPRFPLALKNKFGKAARFFAYHSNTFDCSPPWIALTESFKAQEVHSISIQMY